MSRHMLHPPETPHLVGALSSGLHAPLGRCKALLETLQQSTLASPGREGEPSREKRKAVTHQRKEGLGSVCEEERHSCPQSSTGKEEGQSTVCSGSSK